MSFSCFVLLLFLLVGQNCLCEFFCLFFYFSSPFCCWPLCTPPVPFLLLILFYLRLVSLSVWANYVFIDAVVGSDLGVKVTYKNCDLHCSENVQKPLQLVIFLCSTARLFRARHWMLFSSMFSHRLGSLVVMFLELPGSRHCASGGSIRASPSQCGRCL